MLTDFVDFISLLFTSLVVGSMFGLWLGLNPSELPAVAYVAQHQQLVRGLNVALPVMGAVAIAFTLAAAFLARHQLDRLVLLLLTAACLITAGLVTRFLNQPINGIVMTWSADAIPAHWAQLRDDWWRWHFLRTAAGLLGLCLLLAATLRRG